MTVGLSSVDGQLSVSVVTMIGLGSFILDRVARDSTGTWSDVENIRVPTVEKN